MNQQTLREWLDRRHFEPFVVTLSSGETHEVRHPENAIPLKTRLILGYPERDAVVHVGLLHIDSVAPPSQVA